MRVMVAGLAFRNFFFRALVICAELALAQAVIGGTPYGTILQRNTFGLRPAPPAVKTPANLALPKVHLTGITTILKGKRALLKVEFPAKPPERAKEESYILKEGQSAGPIEVLEINEKTAHVKVNNSGTVTNLTFEQLGPTPAPSAPALPVRAVPQLNRIPYRAAYRSGRP